MTLTPQPRTCVGQWLRALLLDQEELRDRLKLALNGGESNGWNGDEMFVVGIVCYIAISMLYPARAGLPEITAFVTDMRSRIHSTTPPDQKLCEAIIRDVFRDPDASFRDFPVGEVFIAHGTITCMVVRTLGLDEAAVDEMIVAGEGSAFKRGWHPPLASIDVQSDRET